jgi:hypothetical protein
MEESTLFILAGLGMLAWLLAGGWPYARDHVADDGPLGLGAGITAVCPGCVEGGAGGIDADVAARLAAGRPVTAGAVSAGRSLRPLAVGRNESLRLECPACGAVYEVLGTPNAVVPAPRLSVD